MGAINPTDAAIEERRLKCWDLRAAGKTLRQIAGELGLSASTVHKHIDHVLERTKSECNEKAELHRLLSLQRLDKAIAVLLPMVEMGSEEAMTRAIADGKDPVVVMGLAGKSLEAMDRLDKLERRRAALLGLDAPTKQEHSGGIGVANVSLDELESLRKSAEQNECSKSSNESGESS